MLLLVVFTAFWAGCGDSSSSADSRAPSTDSAVGDLGGGAEASVDAASGDASATDGAAKPDGPAGADGSAAADGAVGADGASAATDFTKAGPLAVSTSTGSLAVGSCTLSFTLFTPMGAGASTPLVVLGHGFSRTQANVADVAKHIASFGPRVVTPSYCHSSALDTDHVKNAQAALALSKKVAGGAKVVHVGHSAGGLSALLAAVDDSAAVALVGLDLTDATDLALKAAPKLKIPALGLVGEPSTCNSNGNGRTVLKASAGTTRLLRVVKATHCDFEAPTGILCTVFCGGEDKARAALVRALAAAYIVWQTGLDPSGEQWIANSGSELRRLLQAGQVAAVP